ncbi:MAG: exodeoxyribonuclease III, partial [Betaproteobacteria bacterium]|nr:exodeoxyribonuclease III [Betaproteobacteria bacterium]
MLRVCSLNVNGLRSAASKGLEAWVSAQQPQILCLQEVKAQLDDLAEPLRALGGLRGHFHLAEKKGYSGVALYAQAEPSDVRAGFGSPEFDSEGRYVELRFDRPGRKLSVVSVYFPSGSSSDERQQAKFRFLTQFLPHLKKLKRGREVVLCGDVNIAHQAIDLKNWKSNQKNSGFLPEERAWLDALFAQHGYVDVFRTLNPQPEQYTWWSNRGAAWAKN